MKKNIFISIQYLEIGGAERSLIGFLNAIDYTKYNVDLFVYKHTGEFFSLLPQNVNLLAESKRYKAVLSHIKDNIKSGYPDIALAKAIGRIRWKLFNKKNDMEGKDDCSIFDYMFSSCLPLLPAINAEKEYDLAISYLIPHRVVLKKVRAKKKIAWIHTDYSSIGINVREELPVWSAYDNIITISESVSDGFCKCFPSLKKHLFPIENILSSVTIRQQASLFRPKEIDMNPDVTRLCTIARFSYPKGIDRAVKIAYYLKEMKVRFRWYIVGYGGEESMIKSLIAEYGMEKEFILLGKHDNPYPFLKACDIYVQPSRYEGKAVTVREALILGKPVVLTNFPTAKSHFEENKDGIIVTNEEKQGAEELGCFINDIEKRDRIRTHIEMTEYSNEFEIEKLKQLI